VRRAAAGIAVAAVALPHVDALVFTGGIGQNSGRIRAQITGRLNVLGIPPVPENDVDRDSVLATSSLGVAVARVEAREDLIMAEAAAALIR
jgi:acetate kinase